MVYKWACYNIKKWWKTWRPGPLRRTNIRTASIHDELVVVVASAQCAIVFTGECKIENLG